MTQKNPIKLPDRVVSLWYHPESNQGHTDFQSVALPTELWYLILRTLWYHGFQSVLYLPIAIGMSYGTSVLSMQI